uniref:Uncharacterized protein n=1 Tax=Setaria italica TaxID=4555 RepID=K4AJJ6_SETIT
MPPRRRARLSSRPYSAVAAAEPCPRGWLAVRRSRPSKRARRVVTTIPQGDGDDDGTPLTDEILVGIFAGLPDFSDLVRCAATCRRWCRLVSGEAAFICRAKRCWTPPSPLIRSLALGFFYSPRHGAAPRFAATASASRRLGLRQPSLNALIQGLDDGLFDASRLVASRNGLLVVELQRRKRERALKLCVCNPMTGEVTVLPPLGGKEIVSPFACTVLTADDYYNNDDKTCGTAPASPSPPPCAPCHHCPCPGSEPRRRWPLHRTARRSPRRVSRTPAWPPPQPRSSRFAAPRSRIPLLLLEIGQDTQCGAALLSHLLPDADAEASSPAPHHRAKGKAKLGRKRERGKEVGA